MALETGTFISDLVATNPVASDPLALADDHLRLIKSTVKATFPNITGAVTVTHTDLNSKVPNAVQKDGSVALTGALTLSGNASSALHAVPLQQVTAAVQALYPVGSIYINATNNTNPGTLLGFGTWTAFGAGRVPVGFDVGNPLFDTAEETGGSADAVVVSHTHTVSVSGSTSTEGSHSHTVTTAGGSGGSTFGVITTSEGSGPGSTIPTSSAGSHTHTVTASGTTASAGVSGTNANYQPYITVYMWKRTA